MASNPSDSNSTRPAGLQAMLARLRGMVQTLKAAEQEPLPDFDAAEPASSAAEPSPALLEPAAEPTLEAEPATALAAELAAEEEPASPAAAAAEMDVPLAQEPPSLAEPAAPRPCPACQAPRGPQSYCDGCGYIFPPDEELPVAASSPPSRLRGRYELGPLLGERGGICRYRGLDYGAGTSEPLPVIIVRGALPAMAETIPEAAPAEPASTDAEEVLPTFDEPAAAPTVAEIVIEPPTWPSVGWERALLETSKHTSLPGIIDSFAEDGFEYLIEELPVGQSLWDAWDDPDATAHERFGWLKQIAEALHSLHQAGAMFEGLRPDTVVISPLGLARLTDLTDLLPLPLPPNPPIRGTLYTAPELLAFNPAADARADLYSFGAMLYALHVGRELAEMDFDRPGQPKPFIPRFPDIHPLFGRLVTKTFNRDLHLRFPSDEAAREDATGFTELIRTLEVCQRTLDDVHLEIAAWTTTGMVRTNNEDAFALLHSMDSRQDDVAESALVFLADGMGGYEAGEVAAALAIQTLRKSLLQHPMFGALAGGSAFPPEVSKPESNVRPPLDVQACKQLLLAALKDANRHVYTASRTGIGRRGMGCTAEVVYVTGQHVVVGHVGDSRTYHLHEGRLIQLTRDQTLVNRLVELGTLTPEEAETHPRRNELQQAIGGQPDVEPGLYHGTLKPGDWVVVCSDGVSNHVTASMLKEMLQSEATSAEMAARRLINLVNIEGATDNATVVVIRAT